MAAKYTDVKEAGSKLLSLVINLKSRDIASLQRVNAFVFEKSGKKLHDWIGDDTEVSRKLEILNDLIPILESGDLSKLPSSPAGQATAAAPVASVKPSAALRKAKKEESVADARLPTVPAEQVQPENPPAPAEEQTPAEVIEDLFDSSREDAARKLEEAAMALRQQKRPPPSPPAMRADEIRALIKEEVRQETRRELATILQSIASALTITKK